MPKEILFDETTVLQNATALFWKQGYNGTSMDELTKATGLSRSSIYNTFGDKHRLFIRCLEFYQQQQQDELLAAVGKTSSPLKKIQQMLKFAVESTLQDAQRKGCLVVNTTTELANMDAEVAAFLLKNMEGMEHIFQQWVKAGQQQGEISTAFTPTALARHLFNTYSGMRVGGKAKPERKALEDVAQVALAVLKT